ncbi:MAG: hypothetical protein JNJ47_05930, partial [Alphaproteobacteria bacterium]|nr:hypothetical protein [Alphaproteobacteria bacterium]
FSSSAVYAIDDEYSDYDALITTGRYLETTFSSSQGSPSTSAYRARGSSYLSTFASQRTYRTTGSKSNVSFQFPLNEVDPALFLEIKINHRTPDEKFTPTIAFFNDMTNKYCSIGTLPESDDFTSTSYFIDLSPLYSYLVAQSKPKLLRLSFRRGLSDIHSVTLQQGEMDKKVLQSIALGDIRSESQSRRPGVTLSEWSTIHSVMPRPYFALPDLSKLILLPDPAVHAALSQTEKDQMATFKRLMDKGASCSERLNVVAAAARYLDTKETALFLVGRLILDTQMATFKRLIDKGASFSERLNVVAAAAKYVDNKEIALSLVGRLILDTRISYLERLQVAAVAELIGKGHGISILSKVIEKTDLPFSHRLKIAHSLGERALFTLATDEWNKLEDRVSATQYLEGAMKIIADRKMQRLLEGMSNKDPSISALRGITLLERYNSNEWSKIHCEITMPERLLLKFETHEVNKPEDRVSFTEYLEDLRLDEYLLLNI